MNSNYVQHCKRCPAPDWGGCEYYRWRDLLFDVRRARKLADEGNLGVIDHVLTLEMAERFGLAIWPERGEEYALSRRADGISSLYLPDLDHLAHIPAEDLLKPPLWLLMRRQKEAEAWPLMIDGTHRSARRFREGATEISVKFFSTALSASLLCRWKSAQHKAAFFGLHDLEAVIGDGAQMAEIRRMIEDGLK